MTSTATEPAHTGSAAHAAAEHYQGPSGSRYLAHRAGARSARAQANRADTVRPWLDGLGTVVDFGCGDGGVLSRLAIGQRIGVELCEEASAEARARGLSVVHSLADVAPEVADAVLFCHSLEHVASPSSCLTEARRVLRPGGLVVVLLPAETPWDSDYRNWRPNLDRHLHSWTPLSIGNLLIACGFDLAFARLVATATRSRLVQGLGVTPGLRRRLADLRARLLGRLEILAVATKPVEGNRPAPPPARSPEFSGH